MKKKYIQPTTRVIVVMEPICLNSATVYKETLAGKQISHFDVFDEAVTKSNDLYTPLWGLSNKDKWGDD